ncbi:ABC transporter permease [Chloroflexota bacterium]
MASERVSIGARIRSGVARVTGVRQLPWIPVLILAALVCIAIFGPILSTHDPYYPSLPNRLLPPAWVPGGDAQFLLGTDGLGRDMLTRLIYGARVTLIVALLALFTGGGAGLMIGIFAGYSGGRIDAIISRAIDATLAFPAILIALLLAVVSGPSLQTVIIAISLVLWARFARIMRGEVLSIRELDFIAQAKIDGCSRWRIIMRHIIPNVLNTFMVLLSLNVGYIILVEATLSFLGAGIPPPTPSWGSMISDGREYIGSAWWISIIPGICIGLVVLAFNLFGDWLRDNLDPKLRQL